MMNSMEKEMGSDADSVIWEVSFNGISDYHDLLT